MCFFFWCFAVVVACFDKNRRGWGVIWLLGDGRKTKELPCWLGEQSTCWLAAATSLSLHTESKKNKKRRQNVCVCVWGCHMGRFLSSPRERETLSYLIIGNSIPRCNESFDGNQSQRAAISLDPAERIRNLSLSLFLSIHPTYTHLYIYIYIYSERVQSLKSLLTHDWRWRGITSTTQERIIYIKRKKKSFFFFFLQKRGWNAQQRGRPPTTTSATPANNNL